MTSKLYSLHEIQKLAKTGDTLTAFKTLSTFILHNPHNEEAVKLLYKLKKKALKANILKIEEAINRFKYLEKKGEYIKLLSTYLEIQKFAPDYKPLQKQIQKVISIIKKDPQSQELQQYQKVKLIAEAKFNNNQYEETINFLDEAFHTSHGNPLIQVLLLKYKRKIIDLKIKNNKKAFRTDQNIPHTYNFIKSLYDYEPTYPVLQKLLIKYHNILNKYYDNQKYIYKKDAEQQIKILFNQGKYNKCLQACKELLRATYHNPIAFKYIKKSNKAIDNNNFKQAYSILDTYLKSI